VTENAGWWVSLQFKSKTSKEEGKRGKPGPSARGRGQGDREKGVLGGSSNTTNSARLGRSEKKKRHKQQKFFRRKSREKKIAEWSYGHTGKLRSIRYKGGGKSRGELTTPDKDDARWHKTAQDNRRGAVHSGEKNKVKIGEVGR